MVHARRRDLDSEQTALDHVLDEKACPVSEAFDGIEVAEQHHNHALLEFELVRRRPGVSCELSSSVGVDNASSASCTASGPVRIARHGDEEARLACGRGVRAFMSEAQRTDVRCVQIACTMSAQCGDVKALLPSSKEPCRPQHSHLTTTAASRARKCEVADGAPASRRSWHRCDACPSPRTRALRREHVDCARPISVTGFGAVSGFCVRRSPSAL